MTLSLTINRPDGGAIMKQPASGFADAAISTMFNPPVETSTPIDPTPMSPPGASRSGHRNNINNIVGGVIGAFAGWIFIVAIAICVLRRRRRAKASAAENDYQFSKPRELAVESQLSSPQEMAGEFTHIKEMEAAYPAQELPAEVPVEEERTEKELVELDSSEEVSPKPT
jgi:hypothetical protein